MLINRKTRKSGQKSQKNKTKDDFKYKGRYQERRDVYFKKRSGARIMELQTLSNDVDYLIKNLKTLERRTKHYGLVSVQLRNLAMRLTYLNHRHKYDSDSEIFYDISDYYGLTFAGAKIVILAPDILDEWLLIETDGGKESK